MALEEVKSLFLQEKREICHYRARLVIIIGNTLVPIFSGLDYFLAPTHATHFLILRLINTALSLGLLALFFMHRNMSLKTVNLLTSIYCSSLGLMIVYMCRMLGGYESTYYVGIILVLLGMGVLMPWQTKYTIVNSALMYVAYLIIAYTPDFSPQSLANNSYFLLSIIIILILSNYWAEKLRFKEFAARQDLQDANEQLKSLDKAKSRFISNITHEFRTPLVALSSTIQMMRTKGIEDPDLQEKLLASGQDSLEDMLENVNDLLMMTKSEKGLLEMKWAEIDVAEFVERSLRVFEPIAEKQNNALILVNHLKRIYFNKILAPASLRDGTQKERIKPNEKSTSKPWSSLEAMVTMRRKEDEIIDGLTEPIRIFADKSKLRKIINNLVGNAMKFTKSGMIEITLDKNDYFITLQVRDSGPGIPKEDLSNIFDPFTQASNNILREGQGTGLGLAVVKDFVQKHGGQVSVESELGKGSTFTVTLPLGEAHVDQSKLDVSQVVEEADMPSHINIGVKSFDEIDWKGFEAHNPKKSHVLLVEDNPQIMQALAYVLKDHYNLHFAKNGLEGLEKAVAIKPHLIISDIMMPHMDGYELVREIKAHPDLNLLPVILLTSKSDVHSKIQGFQEGADEYLAKPFNNLEVLTRVKGLIERRKREIEFIHAEKMISIGQLTAGVAHEIFNPISYAKSSANYVRQVFENIRTNKVDLNAGLEDANESLGMVQEGIERVCKIADSLKGFVRQGAKGFKSEDVHAGIDSTLLIIHTNSDSKISFHKQYDLQEQVICNINQLNQVFVNILQNAVQAFGITPNGEIRIHTYRDGEFAYISIRDNGPGIPDDILPKIFEAFFTTKDVGQGTGLGLYISHQIVQEHGGSLKVKSTIGAGSEFVIQLPLKGKGESHDQSRFTGASIDRALEKVRYPHR